MIFFTNFEGTMVELLKVKVDNMASMKDYWDRAQVELNELMALMSFKKAA